MKRKTLVFILAVMVIAAHVASARSGVEDQARKRASPSMIYVIIPVPDAPGWRNWQTQGI
jgi:hypothetical protein